MGPLLAVLHCLESVVEEHRIALLAWPALKGQRDQIAEAAGMVSWLGKSRS